MEVGGVEPKVSPTGKSSSEFDVFALSRFAYASRDVRDVRGVPCVRRRARDRSIGRDRSEGPEIGLRLRRSGADFPHSPSPSHVSRVSRTWPCIDNSLRTWKGHRTFMLESPLFL